MKLTDLLEGKEHTSLEKELKRIAVSMGYRFKYRGFPRNCNPDVLMTNLLIKSLNRKLFLGDAKDADNERPSHKKTASGIRKYIKEFVEHLDDGLIYGGIIAIATNDEEAAEEWRKWLDEECEQCGLKNPSFTVRKQNNNTFIVYW